MRLAAEILAQQIRRNGQPMRRVGRSPVFPARLRTQSHGAHQRLDAIEAATVAVALAQYPVEAWRTVAATMGIEDLAYLRTQAIAFLAALRGPAPAPGVITRFGHAEHPADHRQRVNHEFSQDKGVPHRLSFAKYAATFFRILTSIFERDSSARSLAISACSGLTARSPAATVNWPASYNFSHCSMSLGTTSNLRAHSARERFSAFLCRTTSALNSRVNTRRFSCSFLIPSNALFFLSVFIISPSLSTQRKAYRIKRDPLLRVPAGAQYQGRLCFPYGYGVVFSNIHR